MAGYLAQTGNKKFSCDICLQDLTIEVFLDDENELLILHKSYPTFQGVSHLTAPSPLMVKATNQILITFYEHFDQLKTKKGLKEVLVNICRGEVCKTHHEWLAIGTPCNAHREFLLVHLIKMKIRKQVLDVSRQLKLPKKKHF